MINDFVKSPFEELSREFFADWLWRGLQTFYEGEKANRAESFAPLGYEILREESLSEGIGYIYEKYVSQESKLLFRRAVGDVIRDHFDSEDMLQQPLQDLIYILARIRATESLDSLLPVLGNGPMGRRFPSLLYETFAALESMAPSTHAYIAARQLIDSSNFAQGHIQGYLFAAMKVLMICQPAKAADIVLEMEPRINELRRRVWSTQDSEEWRAFIDASRDWADHMLKLGPVSWISEFWQRADHSPDQNPIFELLFNSRTVPVSLVESPPSGRFVIVYKSQRTPISASEKDRFTRRLLARHRSFEEAFLANSDIISAPIAKEDRELAVIRQKVMNKILILKQEKIAYAEETPPDGI